MAAGKQDAIALLKADHRNVAELFAVFDEARAGDRRKMLADRICLELSVHLKIEEEILYPACEGKVDDDLLDEALVEHDGAKVLITEIADSDPGDDFYDAKVTVLGEMIRHHVKEEEMPSTGLFSQAQQAGLDLDGLGEVMADEKDRLLSLWESDGPPIPDTPTFTITSLG